MESLDIRQAIFLYKQIALNYPGTTAAEEANRNVQTLRAAHPDFTPADLVWELVADKPDREWFIKEHGGLSEERCRWRTCSGRRINGLAFCFEHYFTRTAA